MCQGFGIDKVALAAAWHHVSGTILHKLDKYGHGGFRQSQTCCIMGIILLPGPRVQVGLALLCSRDQSKLLCRRDKALLCSKHPAPFLFFFFVLSAISQMKTLLAAHGWINGRADGNVDTETHVWESVDPFETWTVLTERKKKSQAYCHFFCSILQLRYGLKYNGTIQFFFLSFWKMLRKCLGA